MYKNQLQELAQRSCFNLPAYACIREGPDHAPRFKATVNFNGEVFESPNYCSTLRQAEHSAAEVALNTLSKRGPSQALAARILDETGVYKNLLQEIAQRAGANLPIYTTVRSGLGHLPVFTCTVELAGINFVGDAAKNKKQAEKNAAMAAWSSLRLLPQQMGLCTSAGEGEYNDEQEQITIAKALAIHRADDIAMAQQLKQQQSLARRRMIFQRESSTVNSTGNLALTQWNSSDMLESSSRFTHSPHHQQHHNTTTSTSSPTSKFLPFIRSILSQASTNTNRALTLPEPNMSSSIASNRPSSSPHNSSSSISLGSNKPSSSYISNRPSSASHNSFSSIAFSSNKPSSSHIPTSLGSSNRPSSTHTSSNGATLGSSRPSSSHASSSSNRPTSSHQNEHLPMVLARESRAPMRPTTSIQPMQHRASTQNIHIPFEEHQRDEEEWLRGDTQRSTTSIQSMQHRASTQSIHIPFEEHQRDEEEWLRGDTKTQQNNHVSAIGASKMADWSVGSTMLSAWSNSNSAESWKFQREQWMQHHKQQEEQQTIHSTSSFVRSGCRSSTSSLVAPPVNIRTSRPVCAAPPVRIRSVGDASMKASSTAHGATDMNMRASSTIHGANDVNMRLPSNIHGATDVNARPRRSIHAVPSVQIRSVVPVYAAPPQRQLPTRPRDDVQDHIPLEKDEEDRTMQLLNELRL